MSSNVGGKSGSFFFFSEDNKYIVKTINKTERKVLLKLLVDLIKHMEKSVAHHQSYLAIITGIYEIKMAGFK